MSPPNDEPPPNDRKLRFISFAIHATRGTLRNRQTRCQVMFWIVIAAVVMLVLGATFLVPVLDPRVRPGRFIFYWAACAWITVTAVLLAILDLLMVRAEAREEKRRLARAIIQQAEGNNAD